MDRQDNDMKLDRALDAFAVGEPSADLIERIVAKTAMPDDVPVAGFMMSRPLIAKAAMMMSILVVIVSVMLQMPVRDAVVSNAVPDMSVDRFVNDVLASADFPEQDDPVALLETVAQERQVDRFLDQVLDADDDPNSLF